jgi:hypothetical protein
MLSFLLNPRVLIGIALIGALSFTHFKAYRAGGAAIEGKYASVFATNAEAARKESEKNRQIEQQRQAEATAIERQKDEAILNINSRLADALGGLSDRSQRPASSPGTGDTSTCKGATGAGIYAEDGQFLAREAARADRLRTALAACYSQYDSLIKP